MASSSIREGVGAKSKAFRLTPLFTVLLLAYPALQARYALAEPTSANTPQTNTLPELGRPRFIDSKLQQLGKKGASFMDTNVNGFDIKGNVSADEVKASLGYASQDVYGEGEVKNDYSQNLFSGINQPGQSSYSLGMAQNFNEGALSVAAIAKQDFEGNQSNTLSLGSNNNGFNVTGFMTKNQFNQFIAPANISDAQFSASNLRAQTAGVAINTLNTSFVGTVTTAEGMTNVKGIPTKSEGGKAYQMALQYGNVGANFVQGVGREGHTTSKDISLGYTSPQGVSAGPLTINTFEFTKHSVSDDIARLNLDHSRNSFQAKGHIGDMFVRAGNRHIGFEYRTDFDTNFSPMKSTRKNNFAAPTLSWMQGVSKMHLTGAQEAELSTAEADLKAAQNAHKILELDVKKEKAALEQLQKTGASEVEMKAAEAKVAKAEAILADNEAKQAAAKKAIQSIQNIPASPQAAVDAAKGLGGGMGTVAIGAAVIAGAAMAGGGGGGSTPAPAPEAAPVVPALSFAPIADPATVIDTEKKTLTFTVNNLSDNFPDAATALVALNVTTVANGGATILNNIRIINFLTGSIGIDYTGIAGPGVDATDVIKICFGATCSNDVTLQQTAF